MTYEMREGEFEIRGNEAVDFLDMSFHEKDEYVREKTGRETAKHYETEAEFDTEAHVTVRFMYLKRVGRGGL